MNQFLIKTSNFAQRICNIQHKFRDYLVIQKEYKAAVIRIIQDALNALSTLFIQNKTLQKRFKELLSEINNLEPIYVEKVAIKHMQLTKWIHSINLLRWYGKYQNKGNYNTERVIGLKNAV